MRALLLGASGFLGRYAARSLSDKADVELILHSTGVADVSLDLVRVDIADLVNVLRTVEPDVVINCVGAMGGDAAHLQSLNVDAVRRLIDAIRMTGGKRRFIHIGSAAEYGAGPVGDSTPEDAPPRPVSPYGVSKLAGTSAVLEAIERRDVDGVVLRVFNPIGAGMTPGSLPADAARRFRIAVLRGLPTVELGRLDQYRDYVDASDVGDAIAAATTVQSLSARVLNVGSGIATRTREIVDLLAGISGFHGRIIEAGAGSSRSAAVMWQRADISRARDGLGWEPHRTLRHSVATLVAAMADTIRVDEDSPN